MEQAEQGLGTVIETQGQKIARVERKRKRGQRIIVALMFIMIIGGYLFTYVATADLVDRESQERSIRNALGAVDNTNEQRSAVGLPPIDTRKIENDLRNGTTTASEVASLNTIAKLQTDPRLRNLPTIIGAAGADGSPCLSTDPLCRGLPGEVGEQGEEGAEGQAGASGEPGKPGDPGTPGTPGTNGKDGELGPVGPPGRGIVGVDTDGCFVIIRYTDNTSEREGPFCTAPADTNAPPEDDGATLLPGPN